MRRSYERLRICGAAELETEKWHASDRTLLDNPCGRTVKPLLK